MGTNLGAPSEGRSSATATLKGRRRWADAYQEAAEELFDDCYAHAIPENLRFYFDIEKFARDLEIGGDFNEFEYDNTTYTCTNACCL